MPLQEILLAPWASGPQRHPYHGVNANVHPVFPGGRIGWDNFWDRGWVEGFSRGIRFSAEHWVRCGDVSLLRRRVEWLVPWVDDHLGLRVVLRDHRLGADVGRDLWFVGPCAVA